MVDIDCHNFHGKLEIPKHQNKYTGTTKQQLHRLNKPSHCQHGKFSDSFLYFGAS